MSDRIDEYSTQGLFSLIYDIIQRIETVNRGGDLLEELSCRFDNWKARALKTEAMCEYLAERLEESDDTVLSADTWLAAAREAVKR